MSDQAVLWFTLAVWLTVGICAGMMFAQHISEKRAMEARLAALVAKRKERGLD